MHLRSTDVFLLAAAAMPAVADTTVPTNNSIRAENVELIESS